jgi:DNA-binding MarR family transcriptional regulator
LSVISRLSGCTMNELAEFTTIDRTTLTRTADQLIEAGLVSRGGLPGDRRIVRLELTEKGEAAFELALVEMRRFNSEALEGVSAEDQAHLRDTLRVVIGNITGSGDAAGRHRRHAPRAGLRLEGRLSSKEIADEPCDLQGRATRRRMGLHGRRLLLGDLQEP